MSLKKDYTLLRPISGFRGGQGTWAPLFGKKIGCLYRESLKRDWIGPPFRAVSGPPLMKISRSASEAKILCDTRHHEIS